jgi:hypothetical protein
MRFWKLLLPLLASTVCLAAQPDRVTGTIDSSQTVALARSLHRKAVPQYDQGPVEPSFLLGYVTLVMAPSPSQQQALDQLLAQQQDRSSPSYHKWLTPAQYADSFGLSQNDMSKITAWLKSQGFQIVTIGGGRNSVVFSGTAAQIQSAFGTEIHHYDVNGEKHIANSSPVLVPAALGGVVTGIRGLTDFRPKPTYVRPLHQGSNPGPHPGYTASISGNTYYFLAPGDIATIYDINPLYSASPAIDGTGQKLAIIGQTDVYLDDIADFRSGFGLNPITGCTTNSTGVVTACNSTNFQYVVPAGFADPGTVYNCGDLGEADLDIEWSGATARNAQIIFVNAPYIYDSSCTPTNNAGGVDAALTAAINPPSGPPLAPVISMSYGLCEADTDSLETELQQGNAEGVTIMNSSGDVAAAACDYNPTQANVPYTIGAVNGLAVSYPASSPEVTGVGGTSIPPIPDANYSSTYWGPTNGTDGGSALVGLEGLEAAWNDDYWIAQFCLANATNTFCLDGGPPAVTGWVKITSAETAQEDIWLSGGGGGVSNCFTETSGGICEAGFTQPTWQNALKVPGLTSPQDTYRYVPDVSLLASPNYPGYILCTPQSGTTSVCSPGGTAGITNAVNAFSLVGGTSASTPIFAGIVTLLNQYLSGPSSSGLGNINPMLYTLAKTTSNDAFHRITSGENEVYCDAGTPAGQPTDVICPSAGIFGFSATNFDPTTGYNLVTGLGSVDADKLAIAWAATRTATTTAGVLASPTAISFGQSVTLTATVTPSTAVGQVSFFNNGSTTAIGSATLSGGVATLQTTSLPVGTDSITAAYDGSGTYDPSTGAGSASVTVTQPDFTLTVTSPLTPSSVSAGQSAKAVLTVAPVTGSAAVNFTPSSCTGLPAGATCAFSPSSVTFGPASGTTTLTISTTANMSLPSGAQTITVTGTASTGGESHTATVSLTVTKTTETFTLTPNATTYTAAQGATASVSITVTGTNGFIVGSGSSATTALPVTYTCTGTPSLSTAEVACNLPNNGQPTNLTSVTVSLVTTAPTTQLRPFGGQRIFYALLLPGLFGIVFLGGRRTRGLRLLSLTLVLGFSTLWLSACGGSSSNTSTGQSNPGSTVGTYMVTIGASTGAPTGGTAITFTLPITFSVTAQ